jgi:hypothetical protein
MIMIMLIVMRLRRILRIDYLLIIRRQVKLVLNKICSVFRESPEAGRRNRKKLAIWTMNYMGT